jgi:flagellar basal body-associated protein FliL
MKRSTLVIIVIILLLLTAWGYYTFFGQEKIDYQINLLLNESAKEKNHTPNNFF